MNLFFIIAKTRPILYSCVKCQKGVATSFITAFLIHHEVAQNMADTCHQFHYCYLAGGGEAAVDFVDWQQGFVGFGKQAVGGSYCQCLGVESFTV